jgi:hypothetical protein
MINAKLLGTIRGVNLNAAAPADLTQIKINATKYVITDIFIYNPSATASTATLGFYTAAAAGGTEVVVPAALTTLTGTGKVQRAIIVVITDMLTDSSLYPRLTVAQGGSATADIAVFGYELP